MEINLGNERIVRLQAAFSLDDIQEAATKKRVDAFGQVARLFQRPKPEDITIVTTKLRYEPFWHAKATARYRYDRRHVYRVPVAPEVHAVAVFGNEHSVLPQGTRSFELQAVEHCVEEPRAELALDGITGAEIAADKYLSHPQTDVPDIKALETEGAQVVAPEIRGSFLVRKLVALLMRTFQADSVTEERIDVEEVALVLRPVYAVEYLWQTKDKRQVLFFDGLSGESRAAPSDTMKSIARVLDNDALFDIGADTIGAVVPGANIALKLGRLAARKVIQ
jgi:hypothetical protein